MRSMSILALVAAVALVGCDKDSDRDGDGFAKSEDCNDGQAQINPDAIELCDGLDNDCNEIVDDASGEGSNTYFVDGDNDGLGGTGTVTGCVEPSGASSLGGDCDDGDASVHPGSIETCDGKDQDCNGVIDDALDGDPFWKDGDGDGFGGDYITLCSAQAGFVLKAGDCDDTTDDIYPGASETCDGADNDCDGSIDEDPDGGTTYFRDVDGDKYGNAADQARGCTPPAGYVVDFTDCDDKRKNINPGADEFCNGEDENCNGVSDEDAVDMTTWYMDADLDTYGDPDRTYVACEQPDNYVRNAEDCDDHDDDTSPLSIEYCNGADDDCDGTADEGDAVDASTWYPDIDGDGYGDESTSKTSCDSPPGHTLDDSDCDDADAAISPDAVEICSTHIDENCDNSAFPCGYSGEIDEADEYALAISSGTTSYYSYGENIKAGDFNDDGDVDVWVGWTQHYVYDYTTTHSGYFDFLYGAAAVTYGPFTNGQAYDEKITAEVSYEYMGAAVAVGDLDGDGYDDAMVSSPYYDPDAYYYYYNSYGLVRIYNGSSSGLDLSAPSATITGTYTYGYLGYSMSFAGDTDGDGASEILVGANYIDSSYTSAYMLFENPSGDLETADADATITSDTSGSTYLYVNATCESCSDAGRDFDGDGKNDLIFAVSDSGTYYGSSYVYGRVLLSLGDVSGTTKISAALDVTVSLSSAGIGTSGYAYIYNMASAFGDVDGDGYDDFGYANYYADNYRGAVYVMPGSSSMSATMDETDAIATLTGDTDYTYFGQYRASSIGDVDGDGNAEITVATTNYSSDEYSYGYAQIMYASPSGTITIAEATAKFVDTGYRGIYASPGVGLGDMDGDGYGEFAFGMPYYYGSYGYGQIDIFYGKGL